MPVVRYTKVTEAYFKLITHGCLMVHEDFGLPGTGKTTRAMAKAEQLSSHGKYVVVIDELMRDGLEGVRVYVKG